MGEIANFGLSIYNLRMQNFDKIRVKFSPACLILVVLLSVAACSNSNDGNSNASNQAANAIGNNRMTVSDDLAGLSALIRLPEVPARSETADEPETRDREEVVWHEVETGNPKGKKLIAVLKYSPEITAKIIESAEKHKPAAPADVDAEDWFPPELVAKSQESGDASLKGVEYAANDFLQPPYTRGRLTRINDTDYFVLELSTI